MRLHKNPIYIAANTLTKEEKEILAELLQIDIPSNAKAIVYYSNSDSAMCFTIEVLKRLYDLIDSLDEFIDMVLENRMNHVVGLYAK